MKETTMKVVDCIVKLDKIGCDVRKNAVTPSEVAVLTAEHHAKAGGVPITVIEGTEGEIERTNLQEYSRLLGTYVAKRVRSIFPSATVNFPQTFDEAISLGMGVSVDLDPSRNKLVEHDLSR
jgi:hypothetical protein